MSRHNAPSTVSCIHPRHSDDGGIMRRTIASATAVALLAASLMCAPASAAASTTLVVDATDRTEHTFTAVANGVSSPTSPDRDKPAPRDRYSTIEGEPQAGLVSGTPRNGSGVSALAGSLQSPSGCAGQTDRAHWALGNYASVHGRTTCKLRVGSLGVSTILQKQGWLYWESMLTDHSSQINKTTSYDAHPHWLCAGWGSQNYRGVSTHWSQESTGRYSATTVGAQWRFGC
jgi:hypothetical protein